MPTTAVKDVMTPGPIAIASDAMVVEAARRMLSEDVGSLPVVEGEARELPIVVLSGSEDPVIAEPEDSLDDALQRMASEQVRRLPVVTGGKLVGILAQADIARSARPESTGRLLEEISA